MLDEQNDQSGDLIIQFSLSTANFRWSQQDIAICILDPGMPDDVENERLGLSIFQSKSTMTATFLFCEREHQ